MRDSQQQKVYNAQWGVLPATPTPVAEAQEILDHLADVYGTRKVTITVNRRIQAWGGWYRPTGEIEVPTDTPKLSTVLHEFAHHLSYEAGGGCNHDGGFIEAFVEVTREHLGDTFAASLEAAFTTAGLRTSLVDYEQKLLEVEEKRAADRAAVHERRTGYVVGGEDVWAGSITFAVSKDRYGYWDFSDYVHRAKVWLTESGARRAIERENDLSGSRVFRVEEVMGDGFGGWQVGYGADYESLDDEAEV
jgi:hypothetical protein